MLCTEGTLKLPLGSTIEIYYTTKDGIETKAPIAATNTKDSYLATFKEDDVDLEFQIDNTFCKDRKIRIELVSQKDNTGYSVNRGECSRLKTLINHEQKFHLFRGSHKNDENLICEAATKMDTSSDEASKMTSRLKFNVSYSKPLKTKFNIFVEKDRDQFPLTVMKCNTLQELKSMIEAVIGFYPVALRFGSLILQDDKSTLQELGLRKNDEIFIMTHFVSIHCRHNDETIHISLHQLTTTTIEQLKIMINLKKRYPVNRQQLRLPDNNAELKNHSTLGDYNIKNAGLLHLLIRREGGGSDRGKCCRKVISKKRFRSEYECNQTGERGVICVNGTSQQQFKKDRKYVEDKSVEVISFEIEMRVLRYSSIV